MAYKPKAGGIDSTPNVVPMADIMLVLLIIFMVITPMLQKGVSVDMAKVRKSPGPAQCGQGRCRVAGSHQGRQRVSWQIEGLRWTK